MGRGMGKGPPPCLIDQFGSREGKNKRICWGPVYQAEVETMTTGVVLESAIRATYAVEAEEILKKLAKKQKIRMSF